MSPRDVTGDRDEAVFDGPDSDSDYGGFELAAPARLERHAEVEPVLVEVERGARDEVVHVARNY